MSSRKVGCLTKVNEIVVGDAPCPVFTIHHWSSTSSRKRSNVQVSTQAQLSSLHADLKQGNTVSVLPYRRHRYSQAGRSYLKGAQFLHARELMLKTQEATLNFLVRWCLLDSTHQVASRGAQPSGRRLPSSAKSSSGNRAEASSSWLDKSTDKRNLSQLIEKHQNKLDNFRRDRRPAARTRLLLRDVQLLRERNLWTLARYFFWRWLTWVNVVEILLIVVLAGLCAYQCYELLEDYYSYPTHVVVTNVFNDDFRTDLPAITLCDNNRISKQRLRENFPELNETHFMAISHGLFYSPDNFTLNNSYSEEDAANLALETWYTNEASLGSKSPSSSSTSATTTSMNSSQRLVETADRVWHPLNKDDINWVTVTRKLTKFRPAGHYRIAPRQTLVDSLICANIGGYQIPCDKLKTIESIQKAAICRTFFHDSVLWDSSEPSVAELERNLRTRPFKLNLGVATDTDSGALLKFNPEVEAREALEEDLDEKANEERIRIEMDKMEIIRMRLNFRGHDYANPRELVGGRLAVHSSSIVGEITHKSYYIEPGNWYIYYIERSDYRRLPPPYSTNCHDYDANRHVWQKRRAAMSKNIKYYQHLVKQQANTTRHLLPEYADFLRSRTMGMRECIKLCLSELSSVRCGCWNQGVTYTRSHDESSNLVDSDASMPWCRLQRLMELQRQLNINETTGDDLFFKTCSAVYTPMCVLACPEECFYSSFEVIQQSRSWPSHESQRYSEDRRIWTRLRHEAECCATISIVYTSVASTSLMTEPKYTRQDMVTIISGNIEAWLGISAVHVYLFFEHLYDALAAPLRRSAPV